MKSILVMISKPDGPTTIPINIKPNTDGMLNLLINKLITTAPLKSNDNHISNSGIVGISTMILL